MKGFYGYLAAFVGGFVLAAWLLYFAGCGKVVTPTAPIVVSPILIKDSAHKAVDKYKEKYDSLSSIVHAKDHSIDIMQMQVINLKRVKDSLQNILKTDTNRTVKQYIAEAVISDAQYDSIITTLSDQSQIKDSIISACDSTSGKLLKDIDLMTFQDSTLINYSMAVTDNYKKLSAQLATKNVQNNLIKWGIPAAFILGMFIKK